jgi:hypothetical protein
MEAYRARIPSRRRFPQPIPWQPPRVLSRDLMKQTITSIELIITLFSNSCSSLSRLSTKCQFSLQSASVHGFFHLQPQRGTYQALLHNIYPNTQKEVARSPTTNCQFKKVRFQESACTWVCGFFNQKYSTTWRDVQLSTNYETVWLRNCKTDNCLCMSTQ